MGDKSQKDKNKGRKQKAVKVAAKEHDKQVKKEAGQTPKLL